MIPNLEQKRVANPTNTSITNRSKKGSVQLRDEKNDELIRATIKSSPKTTKQEHSTHESYHLSETQDTLSTEEKEIQKVSRCFSCLQSAGNVLVKAILRVNCAESICQNRLGTIAFQAVLVGLAFLAVGWNMTSVLNAYISETFGRYLVYDFGLSMGAFLCLLCCGCLRRWTNVAECESMLDAFADARGLHEDWLSHCRGDAALVLTVWVLAVCERARELFMTNDLMAFGYILEGDGTMHCLGSFAVSSGLLMACLFRVMRVCRGFYVVIDDFSYNLVTTSNLGVAEQEWNLMQALLRRTLPLPSVPLHRAAEHHRCSNDAGRGRLLPTQRRGEPFDFRRGIVLAGLAQMFLSAASVTDHCARLPSFVNSPLGLGFRRAVGRCLA
ncbi:unnamed protein product [Effrenium voratum]|uniref:Transmembrane protein n=1 Tax=Effrenium voratum TaxID=2562239 RepID=A0AA36N3U2_9DINO|nr:unnamed protein product [Effrenium voratum]